jgi:hypothetical protein
MLFDSESQFNTKLNYLFVHSDGVMEPRELLRALMARDGDNPHSLSVKLKGRVKQPQLHKFISGTAREPRRSTLQPVAVHFGVPIEAFYDHAAAEQAARALGLIAGVQATAKPAARSAELSEAERHLLEDFRSLPDEDQESIARDISQRAGKARAHIQKVLRRMGLENKEVPELDPATAKELEVFQKAHIRAPEPAGRRKTS